MSFAGTKPTSGHVRYSVALEGKADIARGMSASDPGCVKTHTSENCRKYNSPRRIAAACVQYVWTLPTRIPWHIYARGGYLGFHTTKTRRQSASHIAAARPVAAPTKVLI